MLERSIILISFLLDNMCIQDEMDMLVYYFIRRSCNSDIELYKQEKHDIKFERKRRWTEILVTDLLRLFSSQLSTVLISFKDSNLTLGLDKAFLLLVLVHICVFLSIMDDTSQGLVSPLGSLFTRFYIIFRHGPSLEERNS